jgi:hypothetical protein
MFYFIEPEVAGGMGDRTVMDTSCHPPIVSKLEYKFEGWLGDELLESFPCFILTEALSALVANANLSGFTLGSVHLCTSDEFDEAFPNKLLPKFLWLKVEGRAGVDDFGLADDHRLVVSATALDILRAAQLDNADIEEYR